MLQAVEPHAIPSELQALLQWFQQRGGRLHAAHVGLARGKPALLAARDLKRGELVMKVPYPLLLTTDVARHSPIGLHLQAAGETDQQAYFAAFLADARQRPGYWQPLIDAFPREYPHLTERFDREHWALLQGSHAQAVARERWKRLRSCFRRLRDALPRARHIPLRDFAWGWHVAATQRFGIGDPKDDRATLAPLTDLLGHAPAPNCRTGDDREGFEVRAEVDTPAGTALTMSFGALSGAHLLARYGIAQSYNENDTVTLFFDLGARHWLHRLAPELTGRDARPGFSVGRNPQAGDARRLFSFLRLWSLLGVRAARSHPVLAGAERTDVPVLDDDNERAAMQRLAHACERALAACTCPVEEDERLLASGTLTPRQRNAVLVRRGEKRVLLQYLALATSRQQALPAPAAAGPAIHVAAQFDGEGATPAEMALFDWVRREGGYVGPMAFGRENGLRGLCATRDIAANELIVRIPRHLYLTDHIARHSLIGRRMERAKDMRAWTWIGACMAATRHDADGHWKPMFDAEPASFPERPDLFPTADLDLLRGSTAYLNARANRHQARKQFRQCRALLPAAHRVRLRDFLWGYLVAATRAFGGRIDGKELTILVPLADMMNHAVDPTCRWSEECTRHFDIRASRALPRGTPLTITYGRRTNARLLSQYGFCLDENPADLAVLKYGLAPSHWLHGFARALTNGMPRHAFDIHADPLADEAKKLFSYLRLAALPDAQAAARAAPGAKDAVSMIDAANEEAALRLLVEGCERALAEYPCGIEQDERLLAGADLTPNQRNAVRVRRGEKRLLRDARARALEALAVLQLPPGERRAAAERHAEQGGAWKEYFRQLAACIAGAPPRVHPAAGR